MMSEVAKGNDLKLGFGERNPLRRKSSRRFRTFEEWFERWDQCQSRDEMLGLLHGFLEVRNGEVESPLSNKATGFLLELADGHDDHNLTGIGERHTDDEVVRNRRDVAKKALQVLCLRFFRKGTERRYTPFWTGALKEEALFQKVLWFARSQEQWLSGKNYRFQKKPEHPYDILQDFLEDFAKLGWDVGNQYHRHTDCWPDDKWQERIIAARPQFIEILDELKMLRWLLYQDLDEACLAKLTDMALGRELSFPDTVRYRKPKDLGEARWAKSIPAQVLLLYNDRLKQQAIFDQVAQEARAKYEEEQRLAELNRIAQEQAGLALRLQELQQG